MFQYKDIHWIWQQESHDILAFPFCLVNFLPRAASGEKEIWQMRSEWIIQGGVRGCFRKPSLQGIHYLCSSNALNIYLDVTHLYRYSFIPGPFGLCQTLGESLIHAKFHETQNKTNPLNWAWPRITRADQSHYSFKVGQVKSVRFHWCGCHNHKALRWKLIIIWAGCLDKSMTGSPRWMRGKYGRALSFHLFLHLFDNHDIGGCFAPALATSIRDVHGIIWNPGDVPGFSHRSSLTPSS